MWHTYWSSSLSLPNMKAILTKYESNPLKKKVTYNFDNMVNQKDARPDIAVLKDRLKKINE